VKNTVLYRCPAERSPQTNSIGQNFLRPRTYSLSVAFHAVGVASAIHPGNPVYRGVNKAVDLGQPGGSLTFTFVDMNEQAIDSTEFGFFTSPQGRFLDRWEHKPTDRHRGGAVIGMADGSTTFVKWKYPKTWNDYGEAVANGADLEDLEWLRSRLPRK
jgi:prepilin-type processing-associated H-X9-DG protein